MVDSATPPRSDNDRARPPRAAYALVAEPDHRRAAIYRDLVEAAGLEVLITRNGDEAKAMLKRRALPALVIANLSLPRLDGFALLAELKRLAPSNAPPVLVVSSSKELSGAAWNLKERLGVTELLATDADEAAMRETLGRLLPGVRQHAREVHGPLEASAGVVYERWIADTIDHLAADVARRFAIRMAVVSVLIGDQEWFRLHVNTSPRPMPERTSPRTWSFIRQVIEGREPMVVPDVMQHPVFSKNVFPPGRRAAGLRRRAGDQPRRFDQRRTLRVRHRAAHPRRPGDRRALRRRRAARRRAARRARTDAHAGAVHGALAAGAHRSGDEPRQSPRRRGGAGARGRRAPAAAAAR